MMSIIDYFFKRKKVKRKANDSGASSKSLEFYYPGGNVTKSQLEEAIDFMISIETDPVTGAQEYDDNLEKYKEEVKHARQVVRQYGMQISPLTLENMQEEFYSITNSLKYRQSVTHCSVVYSMLNHGWHGIGPWAS